MMTEQKKLKTKLLLRHIGGYIRQAVFGKEGGYLLLASDTVWCWSQFLNWWLAKNAFYKCFDSHNNVMVDISDSGIDGL